MFLLVSNASYKTPMINAGMVFTDRHVGGINYPKGGVGIIAEKLVSGIERLGSKVRYKANVTEILLKDKKAVGVKLSSGEEIYSDVVVSNSTRWDTFGLNKKRKGLINLDNVPKVNTSGQKRINLLHLSCQFILG